MQGTKTLRTHGFVNEQTSEYESGFDPPAQSKPSPVFILSRLLSPSLSSRVSPPPRTPPFSFQSTTTVFYRIAALNAFYVYIFVFISHATLCSKE